MVITTGIQYTFVGSRSGDALTDADFNVAVGHEALTRDTLGSGSTAIGAFALVTQNFTTATDSHNTAVGKFAGRLITTGVSNTLIGSSAGDSLTDADFNVAIGRNALATDTLGSTSIAIGHAALETQNFTTATTSLNVGIGHVAGQSVTTGRANVFLGANTANSASSCNDNVFIGFNAGTHSVATTTGSANTVLGSYAHIGNAGDSNAIAIGHAVTGTSGFTTLGNGGDDIRAAHGNVTWNTVSDQRYKKDIVNSTAGLAFINDLTPRTFKYKNLGELPETFGAYEAGSTEVFKNSTTNHGFIAQEVKAAIDAHSELKDGFTMWGERSDGGQELGEAALVPMLVKALQELSAKNDALAARITTLEG